MQLIVLIMWILIAFINIRKADVLEEKNIKCEAQLHELKGE